MRHEEKVEILKSGYKTLFERLSAHAGSGIPSNVDKKKLEMAYDSISTEYEWVLRKKPAK